jgi:opacity protein-like surface antigen
MNRQIITTVLCAAVLAFANAAHAKNVRVYYPAGHYLGCGEPAADGSGIWSVDPRCPESECHDIVAPTPGIDWYIGAYQLGGYTESATKVLHSIPFDVEVETARVDARPHLRGGALIHLRDWFAIDLSAGAGDGSASSTDSRIEADFRVLTGSVAARFDLPSSRRWHPWVSAGVRALSLRPTEGRFASHEFSKDSLQPETTTALTTGAGVEVALTPRIAVDLSADLGFQTGWSAGAAFVYRGWRRHPWPPPCPPGEPPPCFEWGPYGPTLPFAYPAPAILHNQGLDAIVADIENAAAVPPVEPRTKADLLRLIEVSAGRFARARGIELPTNPSQFLDRFSGAEPITFNSVAGFERLTGKQQRYLLEIDEVITNARPDASAAPALAGIAKRSLRELGASQSQPVIVAASIAAGSLDYWRARGNAWQDAVDVYLGGEPGPALRIKWIDVARADAVGAVQGALGAAISGVGVVAGAGGGALIGSAGNLVGQLF